jgi:hypothetical protein
MSILFATTVTNAKPQARDYKLSDGGGLYLLVRPNGTKLWRLNYRYLEKGRTLAFGAWPAVGLADARARRDEARRLLAAGIDPSHQQKVDAARARVEENDTFKTVAKEWTAKNEREGMAEITLSKIRWLLDKAYPVIGTIPIAQITPHEAVAVLRKVEARPLRGASNVTARSRSRSCRSVRSATWSDRRHLPGLTASWRQAPRQQRGMRASDAKYATHWRRAGSGSSSSNWPMAWVRLSGCGEAPWRAFVYASWRMPASGLARSSGSGSRQPRWANWLKVSSLGAWTSKANLTCLSSGRVSLLWYLGATR